LPGLELRHGWRSDLGLLRSRNEDASGFVTRRESPGVFLLAVADGVGGRSGGAVASRMAIDTLAERVFAEGAPADSPAAMERLAEAMLEAHRRIRAEGERQPELAGMATTCTAAMIHGCKLVLAHVGDSRAYLVREGSIRQLTDDHSLAAEYTRRGEPLPCGRAALENVLTRSVGTDPEPEVDRVGPETLGEGDALVLCTDGLTKTVGPGGILALVRAHGATGACSRLVALARERGGPDNITVQVAQIARVPEFP
jgi:protein phosphatase